MEALLLMHKNIPVLRMNKDDNNYCKITEIITPEHLPVNILGKNRCTDFRLNQFLTHRIIPKNRPNITDIQQLYGADSLFDLSLQSYMTSISDHYWVCHEEIKENLKWENINFFDNNFFSDPIFVSSYGSIINDAESIKTPNTSINGSLPQMWIKKDDKLFLAKSGTGPYYQQPFNESVISDIIKEMNFWGVSYSLRSLDLLNNKDYSDLSLCPAFTNENIEFIPAWHLDFTPKLNHENSYTHYIDMLNKCGISKDNSIPQLEQMIALDFICLNEDRHWGNFGVLRNSTTLEYVGLAPLFDHGNSLGYMDSLFTPNKLNSRSKSFGATHDHEIKYLQDTNFDWSLLLKSVPEILQKNYDKLSNPRFPTERLKKIEKIITSNIRSLAHARPKQNLFSINIESRQTSGPERT